MRIVLILIFLWSFGVIGQDFQSMNKLKLPADSGNSYQFVVTGHVHGSSSNLSTYPASTVLANLDWLNESGDFIINLGDFFLDIKNDIPHYTKSLLDPLEVPLYNAVGNHDISGTLYQDTYGKTFGKFVFGGDMHIVLDTELDDGSIKGAQLEMLKEALKQESNNIFIYAHRPVWSEDLEHLSVFPGNTKSSFGVNYKAEILPLLEAADKPIYFFGGSLGGMAPQAFFYHQEGQITYLQTAVRNVPKDGALQIKVKNGKVELLPYSFTGQEVRDITGYGLELWDKSVKPPSFNPRLIPLYIKQTVFSRKFWYGALFMIIFVWIFNKFIRKRLPFGKR